MRNLLVVLLLFASLAQAQTTSNFKYPVGTKEYLSDMVYLRGGTFTQGRHSQFYPTQRDSNLLSVVIPRRVTVSDFLISDHEVTNGEYREFVKWVQDSIKTELKKKDPTKEISYSLPVKDLLYKFTLGESLLIQNIYPDTTCWTVEFPYAYCEPLKIHYYSHPAYEDYPVVGISFYMALAYCHWKTMMINNALHASDIKIEYRLPSEEEWEYAAAYRKQEKGKKMEEARYGLYPWQGSLFIDKKAKYLANFGQVFDQNEVSVKTFIDDDAFHTSAVRSYPKNDAGVYDFAGNVAEWTEGIPEPISTVDENDNKIQVYADDDLNTAYSKTIQLMGFRVPDSTQQNRIDNLMRYAKLFIRDATIFQTKPHLRLVKGGSWFDTPIYLQCGSRQVWDEQTTSSRIGFRLAASIRTEGE